MWAAMWTVMWAKTRGYRPSRRPESSQLRRHPATAAPINTEAHSARSDINGQAMVQ